MEADLHQRIVVAFESLVGLPVHAFGLAAITIQDASLPAQPLSQFIGSGRCAVARTFFLRGVTQPTTLAARKVPARRVEDSHPLATPWAGEPITLTAKPTGCYLGLYSLFHYFAGGLLPV